MRKWFVLFLLLQGFLISFAQNPQYKAVNDTASAVCFHDKIIDVLANDQHPAGEMIAIRHVSIAGGYFWLVSKTSDNRVKLSNGRHNNADTLTISYSFMNLADTTQFSDTAFVTVFVAVNPDSIRAVADTLVFTNVGMAQYLDPTMNDIDPIPGDSLAVYSLLVSGFGRIECVRDSGNRYKVRPDEYCKPGTYYGVSYVKRKKIPGFKYFSTAGFVVEVKSNSTYDMLDTNKIRARINGYGNQFLDFIDGGVFEVPKGSGKGTVFNSTLWIGGMDETGSLHMAAEVYRQGGGNPFNIRRNYYCGPVMDSAWYQLEWDTTWDRVWKVSRSEIDYHLNHWWEASYTCPDAILRWPAHGDPAKGQAAVLAPFDDRNKNGRYDPMQGDVPEIRGDVEVYFIFNDERVRHTAFQGTKLKAEIHGMAYAFVCTGDTAFNNSIFFHYDIFNRSDNTYHDTYLGLFTDLDIGYASDDYLGCDVGRGSYFGYNGKRVDGTGQSHAYGAFPPAQSVTILAGAIMDPDNLDNPRYDNLGKQLCNESINGINFGDSVIDNERMGMTGFMQFSNYNAGVPWWVTPPYGDAGYYGLLKGLWADSTHLNYGGTGHIGTSSGPACRFLFPGMSDTLDWGTGCLPPNGPKDWTEESAHYNPGDRIGVGVTGPFTFLPGDMQELDVAYVFAQNMTGDSLASVRDLRRHVSHVLDYFSRGQAPCGKTFSAVEDLPVETGRMVKIWPNPARTQVNIALQPGEERTYQIVNLDGSVLQSGTIPGGKSFHSITLGVPNGFYLLVVTTGNQPVTRKLVVIH